MSITYSFTRKGPGRRHDYSGVRKKNSQRYFVVDKALDTYCDLADACCSWNPPTVTINGVELPRSLKQPSTSEHRFTYNGSFHFNNFQEFQTWKDYFTTLLLEARDKED